MVKTETLIRTNIEALEQNFGKDLQEYKEKLAPKFSELRTALSEANSSNSKLEYFKWLDFAYLKAINPSTKALAQDIKKRGLRTALVVGMGGSGINSLVLQNALQEFTASSAGSFATGTQSLKIIVQNNLDPSSLKARLVKLDVAGELDKTAFILISKSGSTDEVTRNTSTIINYLAKSMGKASLGADPDLLANLAKRLVIITEPAAQGKSNLLLSLKADIEAKSAEPVTIATLENHPMIGGRFSMFSPVGMFSAELMGLSSDDLIAGAEACWNDFLAAANITESIVAQLAIIDTMLCRKHAYAYRYSMVYSDSLEAVNKFRAQLKGESLNKTGIDSTVHVPGIGTVNHHSDLELLLKDNNKVLLEQVYFAKPALDHVNQNTGLETFKNIENESNHESLIRNHIKPLAKYLTAKACPVIETIISEQKEKALAYYLMQDMLVTIVQAGLQDDLASTEKLDLSIRQWEVENYKKALRK